MSANDVSALLRFLTKDAKVPLAMAMGKFKEMQAAELSTPEAISKSNLSSIKAIFDDEKVAKLVFNAGKRVSKKRGAGDENETPSTAPVKRRRADPFETPGSVPAAEVEDRLELPEYLGQVVDLQNMVFVTNRAPLVLAFAVTLVKYTMPEQPPSSRLSLAQAVVSMGAQSKAKSIGLTSGATAEDEGWGQGQPVIKVMGRDISVLKRWGYDWQERPENHSHDVQQDTNASPALWGIDLEKLKHLNGPLTFSATSVNTAGLPVYSPEAARNYMFRSFDSVSFEDEPTEDSKSHKKAKKKTGAMAAAERNSNVAALLKALELLFDSWKDTLTLEELDKRAWSWYVHVRPDVEHGVAGWGAKGQIKLADILDLRRQA